MLPSTTLSVENENFINDPESNKDDIDINPADKSGFGSFKIINPLRPLWKSPSVIDIPPNVLEDWNWSIILT